MLAATWQITPKPIDKDDTHCFTQVLRVRLPGTALLGASGSEVLQVWPRGWPRLRSSEGWTGVGERLAISLTWPPAGGLSSSPRGLLCGVAQDSTAGFTQRLHTGRGERERGSERERMWRCKHSVSYTIILEVTYYFCRILLVTGANPSTVGGGLIGAIVTFLELPRSFSSSDCLMYEFIWKMRPIFFSCLAPLSECKKGTNILLFLQ